MFQSIFSWITTSCISNLTFSLPIYFLIFLFSCLLKNTTKLVLPCNYDTVLLYIWSTSSISKLITMELQVWQVENKFSEYSTGWDWNYIRSHGYAMTLGLALLPGLSSPRILSVSNYLHIPQNCWYTAWRTIETVASSQLSEHIESW